MAASSERELIITRVIDAPRALVYRAWTQPEHLARWWGPQGFTTIHCEMDPRVGGAYRFGMRSPQGTDYWKRGVFRELREPERIVFTFAWENADGTLRHELLTTITLDEQDDGTRLTLQQTGFDTTEWRDDHHQGWSSTLERLAKYIATQGG